MSGRLPGGLVYGLTVDDVRLLLFGIPAIKRRARDAGMDPPRLDEMAREWAEIIAAVSESSSDQVPMFDPAALAPARSGWTSTRHAARALGLSTTQGVIALVRSGQLVGRQPAGRKGGWQISEASLAMEMDRRGRENVPATERTAS